MTSAALTRALAGGGGGGGGGGAAPPSSSDSALARWSRESYQKRRQAEHFEVALPPAEVGHPPP